MFWLILLCYLLASLLVLALAVCLVHRRRRNAKTVIFSVEDGNLVVTTS